MTYLPHLVATPRICQLPDDARRFFSLFQIFYLNFRGTNRPPSPPPPCRRFFWCVSGRFSARVVLLCSYMLFHFSASAPFWPCVCTRDYLLAAAAACRLRACASPTRTQTRVISTGARPGATGADVGGVSLAALHGQCGQEQRARTSKRIPKKKLWGLIA
jgi:hypothetical protein